MKVPDLYLGGKRIDLQKRIGKGGEGEVWLMAAEPKQAVKVYTLSDLGSRELKVRAMTRLGLADSYRLISYPREVVTTRNGQFAGFTMGLVDGARQVHELYGVKSRKIHYPNKDYRFLVRAAANTARAVAQVHASPCVIGDPPGQMVAAPRPDPLDQSALPVGSGLWAQALRRCWLRHGGACRRARCGVPLRRSGAVIDAQGGARLLPPLVARGDEGRQAGDLQRGGPCPTGGGLPAEPSAPSRGDGRVSGHFSPLARRARGILYNQIIEYGRWTALRPGLLRQSSTRLSSQRSELVSARNRAAR